MLRSALEHFEEKFTRYATKIQDSTTGGDRLKAAKHKVKVLRMMTELAYYTGMRIEECALLQLKDVIFDGGFVLRIRKKTKTDSGERNIPLSFLAPVEFVNRFVAFWKDRKKQVPHDGLLFVQLKGTAWNTSHVSKEVQSVFHECGIYGMKFHNQRDSFAGLLLLRWLVAFHPDLIPCELPFLSEDLFNKTNQENFKKLVLGLGKQRKFQDTFSYFTAVLAKLLGHGGPVVSLQSYVHVVDWLLYFFTKNNAPDSISFASCKVAEDFLQVTFPSLPASLKGHGIKTVGTDKFLQILRDLIDLPRAERVNSKGSSRKRHDEKYL